MGLPCADPQIEESEVEGARVLLNVLLQREKTLFQDIITGDESWIFIDMAPSLIWLSLDKELPTRPRRTIGADKRILITFLGSKVFYT
jgi:hypothetical protein